MKYLSENILELDFAEITAFMKERGGNGLILNNIAQYPKVIQKYLDYKKVSRSIILCEKKEDKEVIICYLEPVVIRIRQS